MVKEEFEVPKCCAISEFLHLIQTILSQQVRISEAFSEHKRHPSGISKLDCVFFISKNTLSILYAPFELQV